MSIQIYTRPHCGPCLFTKRRFDNSGLAYTEHDLATIPPDQIDKLRAAGHRQAPVVITETEQWSGLNIAKIEATIKSHTSQTNAHSAPPIPKPAAPAPNPTPSLTP
ncbi:glutaredoxin family protein [Devriesea agamarum]|uniref:glutaredoxin family protein n=1 Tax=Devriesea agamarum TaxID=472569 RepID=UPI00071CB671|nr:glutaredoxin family protein [Devriesea agamarum]